MITKPTKMLIFKCALALIGVSLSLFIFTGGLSESNSEVAQNTELPPEEQPSTYVDTSTDADGDTFSIVAYDSATGEVGGAGCSCFSGTIDFLSDLITDGTTNPTNIIGAIHTQAAYLAANQTNARNRMTPPQSETPQQIVTWLENNDCCSGTANSRQYGVVGVDNPGTGPAGFTGATNGNYANHLVGTNGTYSYAIQGNILDTANGQDLLEDMEVAFNSTTGTLGDKLMAALQGAKRIGGDNRCRNLGTGEERSGRAAFVKVLAPGSNTPYILETVHVTANNKMEPIDVLQCNYDTAVSTPNCRETVTSFPYTMDFETTVWEREETCSNRNAWTRTRHATSSSNTGPSSANQGTLYAFIESSDLGQGFSRRAVIGSPCFVIPSNTTVTLSFDYHMFGSAMGTLNVTVSDDNGGSWNTEETITGDQGNSWTNDHTVDLSAYAGSTIKIRFDGTTGGSFTSDMAIDDIQLTVVSACPTTTNFTGGAWDNGAPTINTIATVSSDYDTATNGGSIDACNISVTNNATLTISANDYLNVNGTITVDAGATLLVRHQGSVVQVDKDAPTTNNGTINVEITTPVLQTRDFMVMGSPMSADTRQGVYSSAFLVLEHFPALFIPHPGVAPGGTNFADDNGDFWTQFAAGPINVGEGYIVRPQSSYTDPANTTYNFTHSQGTLNNGDVLRTIVYNGAGPNPNGTPNVLSNPYASPIDADDVINDNALINEVYFWEHLTPPSSSIPGHNTINFSMDDISMYNLAGGTAAANDPGTSTEPNGIISTGQGFGIKATAAGTVTFTNSMRRTSGNTTLRNPQNMDRLWLRVSSPQYELGSNTLIAFSDAATPQLDPGYDSERIATVISMFSHLEDGSQQLGIQTREAFDSRIKIPMGFASQVTADSEYEISIEHMEGVNLEGVSVFLTDNELNVITELTSENYIFRSNEGTFAGRFTLTFERDNILGNTDNQLNDIVVYPNPTRNVVNVTSPGDGIQGIEIFDINGRSVMNLNPEGRESHQFDLSALESSVYFVKVKTNSRTFTKRIVRL